MFTIIKWSAVIAGVLGILFITWCLCKAASDADDAMGLRDEDIWKEEDFQ